MRKKDKIRKEAVQGAASALSALSRKDAQEVSRKAAAGLLKSQVRAARARGATWQEIAEALATAGVDISVKTLARVLEEDKTAKAGKVDKKTTKKAVAAPPPGAGVVPPPVTAGEFKIKPDRGSDL